VQAKADHRDDRQREYRGAPTQRHPHPFACARRGEDQKRECQPGSQLDAHAGHERTGAGAQTRSATRACRGQRKRCRKRQQQQQVVVGTTNSQHQHHRIQAHERDRPRWRMAESRGCPRDQRDRAEARGDGDRLEGPQAASKAQRRDRIAQEREQRTVGGVLKRPADEQEHGVGRRLRRNVRVGVQPMQRPQACERQVAEHVLGDQRRPEQQDQVRRHDRARQQPHR
jgi:hypothetical protein